MTQHFVPRARQRRAPSPGRRDRLIGRAMALAGIAWLLASGASAREFLGPSDLARLSLAEILRVEIVMPRCGGAPAIASALAPGRAASAPAGRAAAAHVRGDHDRTQRSSSRGRTRREPPQDPVASR